MQADSVVRIIFTMLFLATLVAGVILFRNFEKLFGPDPAFPSDNAGARGLNKLQAVTIWLHLLGLTAALAIF